MTAKRLSVWIATAGYAAALHAQAPKRLPVIAGEMGVNVMVEVDGTVKAWGAGGGDGPYIGDGSEGVPEVPTVIPGLHDIVDVAVGRQHVLVVQRDGTVLGWGRNNGCELGVKDDRKRLTPIVIAGVRDAVQVVAGDQFSGALLKDGTVMVWGASTMLGDPHRDCIIAPMLVNGLTGVKKIAAGGRDVLVLEQDGTVWGWGENGGGELCDGTTERRDHPVQMHGIANAVDIATSGNSAIVLADGTLRMCGSSANYAMATLPEKVKHTTPVQIPGVANVVAVRMAGTTLVRLKDGTLLGWGNGMHGSLGDGFVDKTIPKPHAPIGLGPVLAHYYASNEGYAIKADGTVMAWGFFVGGDKEWALKPVPFYKVKLQ